MDTLMKNTTLGFSRRAEGYEHLIQVDEHGSKRVFSRPRIQSQRLQHQHTHEVVFNLRQRTERARQRQIFLQTYKLTSMDNANKSKGRKLKRVVNKVKCVVISAVSFIWADANAMGSCICTTSISSYSPRISVNCC